MPSQIRGSSIVASIAVNDDVTITSIRSLQHLKEQTEAMLRLSHSADRHELWTLLYQWSMVQQTHRINETDILYLVAHHMDALLRRLMKDQQHTGDKKENHLEGVFPDTEMLNMVLKQWREVVWAYSRSSTDAEFCVPVVRTVACEVGGIPLMAGRIHSFAGGVFGH